MPPLISPGLTLVLAAVFFGQAGAQQPQAEIERLTQIGQQKLREGKPQEAEEAFRRLEALVQAFPSARGHLLLARAWAQIDANRSFPWLEKVFEASPEDTQAWELWADIMTAAGRYDVAISRLEQQLRRYPRAAHLHLLLAQILVNTGALGKAEKEFWEAEKLAPNASELSKRALYSLGYLYASLGRIEEGQNAFRRVLELDGSYVPALAAFSELLLKMGQADEAGRLIARARELEPEDPEVLLLAGQYHVKRKEWNHAASVLGKALRRQPDHLQAHFFLAQALKGQGKLKEAMEHFTAFGELKKRTRAQARNRHGGLAVEGIK